MKEADVILMLWVSFSEVSDMQRCMSLDFLFVVEGLLGTYFILTSR